MKINAINLNRGTDWSKIPCAMETPAGVLHLPGDHKKEECILIGQQWRPTGYSLYNAGDYLGLKVFRNSSWSPAIFSRVKEYREARPEQHYLDSCGSRSWSRDGEYQYIADSEVRIYKDRTCVAIQAIDYGEEDEKKRKYFVITNSAPRLNDWSAPVSSRTGLVKPGSDGKVTFVETEEEIKALARPYKADHMRYMLSSCDYLTSTDLSRRVIYSDNLRERNASFSVETREMVKDFLNINAPENAPLRSMFCRKNRISTPDGEITLNSLRDLFQWLSFEMPVEKPLSKKSTSASKETREEHAIRLATLFKDEWEETDRSKYANTRLWAREGDEIVLVLPSRSNGMGDWWYGDNGKKKVFSFNVKTRKRFMAEYDTYESWEFPIPSLNYITSKLSLTRDSSDAAKRINTIIKDGLTPRELFEGTNIAWILDNVSRDVKTFHQRGGWRNGRSTDKLVSVYDELSNKNIGVLALEILVSTGIPAMEQLLKSKLFNLYFCMLEDMMDNDADKHFCNLDKKTLPNRYACLSFHGKQKNLKKMFGLRMNQLRRLDDEAAIKNSPTSYMRADAKYFVRDLPRLFGIEKALGTPICDVDDDTFARILKLSSGKCPVQWDTLTDVARETVGGDDKAGVKQIISLCEAYASEPDPKINYTYRNAGIETYVDYLRSRASLKKTQAMLEAAGTGSAEEIFSEKRYPIRPEKARRFIPFVEGMRDRRYTWRTTVMTQRDFLEAYRTKYKDALTRGDLSEQWTLGEDGVTMRLAGVLVHMNPRENVQFLHDDAAYWVSFYRDESQNALFEEAVKRVQSLEWVDPKSGLQIVAPKSVHELKDEGAILHHCVGGYVDAIIGGKDNIMFLRRSDMPDHPFFTVEIVHDGEIRQVHCYGNLNPNEEDIKRAYEISGYDVYNKTFDIQGFLKKWAAAMKGKVDARSIQPRYHALCALR